MKSLKQVPFLIIFILFVSGIILMEYTGNLFSEYNYILISLIIILSLLSIILLRLKYKLFLNILFALIIILSGMENHFLQDERNKTNHFSKIPVSKNNYFISKIISKKKTTSGTSFIVELKSIKSRKNQSPVSGNLLLYTDCDYDSCRFMKGDLIQIPALFYPITKNKNPLAFNPKKYYHFLNVHYLAFPDKLHIKMVKKGNSGLINYFSSIRNTIKNRLNNIIENDTAKNIAISIILGDKQNLNKNILTSFSATGTRHILTVSGMHVGIIALILNFLFSFFKSQNKIFTTIRIIIILSGIWFYAFLTGGGAAVMRAAFMISLIMTGINLHRYINVLNILFGSALIILLFNPYQLFQLGFILSYSAMLSILLFYQPINSYIKPQIKLFKYLWQLISISLSAQILIFPLTLYFFHNAPVLFFLTAIIATPMAFGTIFLGFSTLFLNIFSNFPAKIIAKALEVFILNCLDFIKYIESISFNLGKYIFIDSTDILIITFSVIAATYLSKQNKIIFKYSILMFFVIFTGHQYLRYLSNIKNEELIIYSANNALVADIFLNGHGFTYANGKVVKNKINYFTSNYRYYKGNGTPYVLPGKFSGLKLIKNKNIIKANNKMIVFINSENDYLPENTRKIDFLVIDGNIKFNMGKFLKEYNVSEIILSNRTNFKNRNFWEKTATEKNIKIWDIKEKGAFINKI